MSDWIDIQTIADTTIFEVPSIIGATRGDFGLYLVDEENNFVLDELGNRIEVA